jgi:hypothetical protein
MKDIQKNVTTLRVGMGERVGAKIANETAYYQEGTWYLNKWLPGTKMIRNDDHECLEDVGGWAAILSGTILTNIRIVKTQEWDQPKSGWDEVERLSILSKGWTGSDRLLEGNIIQKTDLRTRDGKRKRGASGWWWPTGSTSPRGTSSTTPRSKPSWPIRRQIGDMREQSCTGVDTDIKHRELWASLSLVASIGNQDQGEPLHGGVHGQGAGALHGHGDVDGQRDDGDTDSAKIYLPIQTGSRYPERRCYRDIEHRDGVLGGGEGGGADGQPAGDDGRGEVQGPGGGHSLLVVTGKRRGRPRKDIVPDGLVQGTATDPKFCQYYQQ